VDSIPTFNLQLRLASLHVRAHQDGNYDFDLHSRPAQFNRIANHLATEVLSKADRPAEFYPLPACLVYLRDGSTGYITSHEKRAITNEFPDYVLRAYIQQRNNWVNHIYDSISWTTYRASISILTDNARTFVIKINHG
jgi:hypothetical protein